MRQAERAHEDTGTGHVRLPDLLEEQARLRPGAVAARRGEEALTFRELADRAAGLAARLRRLGAVPDGPVGLFAEPSLELMAGVWGILYSGAAYLPLSPEYPAERLRAMIADSRIGLIVAQRGLAARVADLAPPDVRIVTLDESAPAEGPAPDVRGGNLAYVIYTSGSTGRPKGVMVEHRGIVGQLNWLREEHGLGPGRVVLQKTPMSFDAAQWEILAPGCGAQVVMGDPGVYGDPERLVETVRAHRVTTLQCVPTLLRALLDVDAFARCSSLTQVFSGGEALSKALAMRFLQTLPGCLLVNLYGPTECTINSSSFTVDPATVAEGPQQIPIGVPAHGTTYAILDGHGAPARVGEVGELYIGGVQVARGYLNRPALTAERFVAGPDGSRLYRTGDLASRNADGTVQFAGRVDNQVKLRGFRIELDEVRLAIEDHAWVRDAAVVVQDDERTGFQNLVAFLRLDPREAALMDQGSPGAHHVSKRGRLQLRAQLSGAGCRDEEDRPWIDLPGRSPTPRQTRRVFARKTYRFFEGGLTTRGDLLGLLGRPSAEAAAPRPLSALTLDALGAILRYFGQFHSDERLLPKYGYASPGSLYAAQLYLDAAGIAGLEPGCYYYHPVRHRLVLIRRRPPARAPYLRVHFVGRRSAIEPVYTTNVREVLEIEAGHMTGLLDEVLPEHGLGVGPARHTPQIAAELDCDRDDLYLGGFEIVPWRPPAPDGLDLYVQAHPGKVAGLREGLYRHDGRRLVRVGDDLVLKKHVIAINQQVYERASFGVWLVGPPSEDRHGYLRLGRRLHRLQANDLGLGLMPSGYSSESGHDLPAAVRIREILAEARTGPSYFAVGGRISHGQMLGTGMKEDSVHMRGPTEMIRDDLVAYLPHYMLPNRVVIVDDLPLTASGKVDLRALRRWRSAEEPALPHVEPATPTERRIAAIWRDFLKRDRISARDDFFGCGGNSLIAVGIVHRINREYGSALPLQVMIEAPTVAELARLVDEGAPGTLSRLIRLRPGPGPAVYCWPGLGGYPMSLRELAERVAPVRGAAPGPEGAFVGVQAYGLHEGETPYPTIEAMAEADVAAIRGLQPSGPYLLCGYSFGARVAHAAAAALEAAGERVERLLLIAPGMPRVEAGEDADREYLTVLLSVFTGGLGGPLLPGFLASGEDGRVAYLAARFPGLGEDLVRRIVRVVRHTYGLARAQRDLPALAAPITVFTARGDAPSPFEDRAATVVALTGDHYALLKAPGVEELAAALRPRLPADRT